MNINTGELISLNYGDVIPEGFIPVPQELEAEALRTLEGQQSAFIDLKGNTPIAAFAHSQRAKKEKARRKMARASKHRNRR